MADPITILIDRLAELTGGRNGAHRVPALADCTHCGAVEGHKHKLVLCAGNRRDRYIGVAESTGLSRSEAEEAADAALSLTPYLSI